MTLLFHTCFQDGRTALFVAAGKGNTRFVERLAAAGADVYKADKVRESIVEVMNG